MLQDKGELKWRMELKLVTDGLNYLAGPVETQQSFEALWYEGAWTGHSGFADGRRPWVEKEEQGLETGKDKRTNYLLESPERNTALLILCI